MMDCDDRPRTAEYIARQPHGRTGLKHLFKGLRIAGEEQRQRIESSLERLTARGDLIELPNHHYAAASRSREYVMGRVSIHRDGFGFLIPVGRSRALPATFIWVETPCAAR